MKIETVSDLISALKKFPPEYKIDINVDNAYTSNIISIYHNQYYKERGKDIITIKV